jgi:5-formyltetrahydrofolate cyclo-ligase
MADVCPEERSGGKDKAVDLRNTKSGGLVGSHNKVELRRQCQKVREAMSAQEVKTSSDAVCAHLSMWLPLQQAYTVLSFLAFRNEIDLSQLFEIWPDKRWLVPRIVEGTELAPGQKPYLTLHPYDPARLARHRFGMWEPEPGLTMVAPSEVQVVLVPGVAFDRQGGRLGFGGGFYDRLIPSADGAISVGVTYDRLVLDTIPVESWDCRVEWLVTPLGLIRTSRGQPGPQRDPA